MRKMVFNYSSQPIMTVHNNCKKRIIVLDPNFQRGYIWKNEFRDELIVSIISNYPIGNIILTKNKENLEVVDGQQRLRTIINFIGEFEKPYIVRNKKSVEKLKILVKNYFDEYINILSPEEIREFKNILSKNTISYKDLPSIVKDDFMSYNLNITTLTNTEERAVIEYFKFVQNQETLKAGEIINSIYLYNDDLYDLVFSIDNKDSLLNSIGFSDRRNDFDKHFVNVVGVLNNKLSLNTSQGSIIDYSQNYKSTDLTNEVKMLITNLNSLSLYINNLPTNGKITSTNVRMLKVMLSYFAFYEVKNDHWNNFLTKMNEINDSHKNNDQNIIDKITFIEQRQRSYTDLETSADNIHKYLEEVSEDE